MISNGIKLLLLMAIVVFSSCRSTYTSKNKNVPVITPGNNNNKTTSTKPAAPATGTPVMTKRTHTVTTASKVIWVNDKVAKKNFDGRLYYDLDGRRYWKNYIDGKYYLYNKAMYNNPAFKPR